LLRNDDIDRAERWFGRHGPKAVFFGRLLPVIRTFISLPAGFAEMPPARFGIYTVAGCVPWTLGLAWAGYAVGRNWQAVASAFHGPTYALAALACILAVAALVVLWRRRHREGTAGGGHFVGGATPRPASRQTSSHGRDTERAPGGSSVGKSDVHAAQPPRA